VAHLLTIAFEASEAFSHSTSPTSYAAGMENVEASCSPSTSRGTFCSLRKDTTETNLAKLVTLTRESTVITISTGWRQVAQTARYLRQAVAFLTKRQDLVNIMVVYLRQTQNCGSYWLQSTFKRGQNASSILRSASLSL
jgi:hypothetical protein